MSAAVCECGNRATVEGQCDWCADAAEFQALRDAAGDHCRISVSRITGDVVCVECSQWCDCLVCVRHRDAS